MSTSSPETAVAPGITPPQVMREVLGHFPSGIVVITADGPEGPAGFTCQSFASLSLDPPLITFSPARSSTTWPRIREIGAFCINVLAEDHEHHSARFARSGTDKFAGVDWTPTPSGAPLLPGVSAWIDCELWKEYDGGDHTIVVGRVRHLAAHPARLPLLFYRGGYAVTAPADRA
ncbi:flavin reductase family protein [Nocardia sp. CA-107356]|uniref:flavin reductase family protein n=1 Tax=Nocardia sp. CA-107356 TaxID=3239972 RepID=UPI003D8BD27C